MEENKKNELSWNLAEYLIIEIADLLKKASKHYILNDWGNVLYCLIAIRSRIPTSDNQKLIDLQNKENSLMEKSFSLKNKNGFNKPSPEDISLNWDFVKEVKEYNDDLMEILKETGLYIPLKQDKTDI